MRTSIWGPSAWRFLHAVTFAYPDNPSPEHKEAAKSLFKSLKLLLPCGDCCSHYCSNLDAYPVDKHLESRDTLSRWLVAFHNRVNERLGKPQYPYEKAKSEFDAENEFCSLQSSCADEPPKSFAVAKILAFLIAVFLVLLVLRRFV